MADFQTLYQNLAIACGLETDSTDLLTERKLWINTAYRMLVAGHEWDYRRKKAELQTVAAYSTGTIMLSAGDKTVTGTGTTFTAGMAGRRLRVGDRSYELATFTDTTHMEMTSEAVADVDAGSSFEIFEDRLTLPSDFSAMLAIWTDDQGYRQLECVTQRSMATMLSRIWVSIDPPELWTPAGAGKIQVYPIPEAAVLIHVSYEAKLTELSGDSDLPSLLPEDVHYLIGILAESFYLKREKDWEGYRAIKAEYQMALAQEIVTHAAVSQIMLGSEFDHVSDGFREE